MEEEGKIQSMKRTLLLLLSLKMGGRRQWAKDCGRPVWLNALSWLPEGNRDLVLQIQELNTGNLYGHGKGSSTRASRKEHSPSNTLIVAEWDLYQMSNLNNHKPLCLLFVRVVDRKLTQKCCRNERGSRPESLLVHEFPALGTSCHMEQDENVFAFHFENIYYWTTQANPPG